RRSPVRPVAPSRAPPRAWQRRRPTCRRRRRPPSARRSRAGRRPLPRERDRRAVNAPLPAAAAGSVVDRAERQAQIVAALAAAVPAHALLWRREDTVPYECDGLTAYREQPLVVVLPESEQQVADVLAICHRLEVPVVARGAGTGLSGGALPNPLGVTLSLAKFNRILAIDRKARTATVQSGV